MKYAYYIGQSYRTSKISSMLEWFETLRFRWGANAIITITGVEPHHYDEGMFEYKIKFEVPNGVEDVKTYIREREGAKR